MALEPTFEADLLHQSKWPAYSRKAVFSVFFAGIVGFGYSGINAALTDGEISSILFYSIAAIVLSLVVIVILSVQYGGLYKTVGRLIINDSQIITNDATYDFDTLQKVALDVISYNGQTYLSDGADGDGICFITIRQDKKEFVYSYRSTSEWHETTLMNLTKDINQTLGRELFTKSTAKEIWKISNLLNFSNLERVDKY